MAFYGSILLYLGGLENEVVFILFFLFSATDNVFVVLIGSNPPSPRNRIFYSILYHRVARVCVCARAREFFHKRPARTFFTRVKYFSGQSTKGLLCASLCVLPTSCVLSCIVVPIHLPYDEKISLQSIELTGINGQKEIAVRRLRETASSACVHVHPVYEISEHGTPFQMFWHKDFGEHIPEFLYSFVNR